MVDAIWLAALAVANVWAAGSLGSLGVATNTETGAIIGSGGAAIGALSGASQDRRESRPMADAPSEERFEVNNRTLIGPPIPAGLRVMCEEPPTHQEILRAMPRANRGIPFVYEEFRDDIEITTEKLTDKVDPPRFFPLIGPAQMHHCHWKCTVYFTETVEVSYPFPMKTQRRRTEIVYIDKDHLHLCVSEPQPVAPRYTVDSTFQSDITYADDALHPNRKIPGLTGRVWLFSEKFIPVHADGTITIEMHDQNPDAKGTPQLLSVWKFDEAVLKQLASKDNIGVGYSLFLPCDPASARVERVKLAVTYTPADGQAATMQTAVLKLRHIRGLMPAGQWEESDEPPLAPGRELMKSMSERIESFLAKLGIINRHSTDPMVRMEQMLIDSENLRKMHDEWRQFWMNDQPSHLTPYRIQGGVGPASSSITDNPDPKLGPFPIQSQTFNVQPKPTPSVCQTLEIRVAAPDVLTIDTCKLISKTGKEMPQDLQQIRGEHLVRPDGTISLGTFGCVKVDGMTLAQVKNVVEHHLSAHFVEPSVAVDVKAFNSSKAKKSQVHLAVLVAEVDEAVFAKLPFSAAGNEHARFEVLSRDHQFINKLQALRDEGKVKFIARPNIMTLSGQEASFFSGGETPILASGDSGSRVTYQRFGTSVNLLPTVQPDGRIQLKVGGEICEANAKCAKSVNVTANVSDGQTIVVSGESLRTKDQRPCLIVVTPHLVNTEPAAPAVSVAPMTAETRANSAMTMADVVRLSKRGISEDIIIQQIENTGATFQLTVDDILELNGHGVRDNVIRAMQRTVRARPASDRN